MKPGKSLCVLTCGRGKPHIVPPNHDIFLPTKEELPVGGSSLLTWQDWMGGGIAQRSCVEASEKHGQQSLELARNA